MENYDDTQQDTQPRARRTAKEEPKKTGKALKIVLAVSGVAFLATLGVAGWINNFLGARDWILGLLPKGGLDKDLAAIAETLPLDNNGVISITFPAVDRTNYNSFPAGFVPYYFDGTTLYNAELIPLENENGNSSVVNYNLDPDQGGCLGIEEAYSRYLDEVSKMKAQIAAHDETVVSALIPIKRDVPDLYLLSAGYQLYCDDAEVFGEAKVAEEHEDGSVVYKIPAKHADKFVGVSAEVCNLIVQYDTLMSQMVERYFFYYPNVNAIGVPDEPKDSIGR